jgi:hypothetical protein
MAPGALQAVLAITLESRQAHSKQARQTSGSIKAFAMQKTKAGNQSNTTT